jgi:RES domain-containing protein
VRVWRICKRQYAEAPFSGDGGLKAAMRWNHKGRRIVYTSQSLSLATLELWVHVDPLETLTTYVAVSADIPDDLAVMVFEEEQLPPGWRNDPSPVKLRDAGAKWLASLASVVARVPSAIIPNEHNYLLNPEHKDFARIQTGAAIPFVFDHRMWRPRLL